MEARAKLRYARLSPRKTRLVIDMVRGKGVQDALNMMDAGATLIQIYTGFIYEGPGLARRINRAILERRLSETS